MSEKIVDVFSLPEGRVIISIPSEMSVAELNDLEAFVHLFVRKMRRRVRTNRERYAAAATSF